jgi:MFS family permease
LTDIPLRLDRLPWSSWHWLVALSLGTSWILDGLIVSCLGLIGSRLQEPEVLGLSATQIGLIGSIYIAGAITGSILFGFMADHFGRKRFAPRFRTRRFRKLLIAP